MTPRGNFRYACPSCPTIYESLPAACGKCGTPMGARAATVSSILSPGKWEGKLIDDRYRVLDLLGSGGMGAVYRVRHERLGKIAAMKVLRSELAQQGSVIKRFRQEAAAVSRLTHPNIVQVFDFGVSEGNLYLIMEYVRGSDLEAISQSETLTLERIINIAVQTCSAIAEAHSAGIVHRDLKPDNVLVGRTSHGRDVVKVVDFGLAKLQENKTDVSATEAGLIVGTPYFMAPEQIRGEEVSPQTDIYSFGATLFRVASGEYPYTAQSPVGILTKHLSDEIPALTRLQKISPELLHLDAIIQKAMQKKPADRYQSAAEMSSALEELAGTISGPVRVAARPPSAVSDDAISAEQLKRSDLEAFETRLKRRKWRGVVFLLFVLIAGAGAGYYFLLHNKVSPPNKAEIEPNNRAKNATSLTPSVPIRAFLGKRTSADMPDTDFYKVNGLGERQVKISVTPIPNIKLDIVVLNARGEELSRVAGEDVGKPVRLIKANAPDPLFVVVGQVIAADGTIIENVSDAYTITVEPL